MMTIGQDVSDCLELLSYGSLTLSDGVDAADLDYNTNDHDRGTHKNSIASSKLVANEEDKDSAHETSYRINRNHESLVCAATLDMRECASEYRCADNTTHNTLIVTKE